MSLQSDFRIVTDRIIAARKSVAAAETRLHLVRAETTEADAALDTARRALMARSEAGTNDNARRAYAERETVEERERLERMQQRLVGAEIAHIEATAALRMAEDERRYLEFIARLVIAGVDDVDGLSDAADAAENGVGSYTLDAANNDLF